MTVHVQPKRAAQSVDATPILEAVNIAKYFGATTALSDVSLKAWAGKVTVLLGDNGAGKSTLIKILSGVYRPDAGELRFKGQKVSLSGPNEARALGIATCYQDLAVCDLLSVTRNIVLGQEPTKGFWKFRIYDARTADRLAKEALDGLGVKLRGSLRSRAATLSGGQKQSLAIARAMYFGSSCLILDEPTAALAVRQATRVIEHIDRARQMGNAVILITHNFNHALEIADHLVVFARGRVIGSFERGEINLQGLTELVSREA
ncbi:sugar ABC transporter ATP-binding protein [Agrobacterium tumefaciens]|uniref:ATP-binding cassette domain-containing protein n=1 Tax=Agrobacterium tumefaciens TaxID=358 RepID=UPI0012B9BA83|nr:ATP-binding cassette domain-containing protein [Agrobacterium tumefaciens]MQB07223.1 sugar ABC transporter ATP-binding protein [Agrobacterium tumefaciens]